MFSITFAKAGCLVREQKNLLAVLLYVRTVPHKNTRERLVIGANCSGLHCGSADSELQGPLWRRGKPGVQPQTVSETSFLGSLAGWLTFAFRNDEHRTVLTRANTVD